MVKMSGFEPMTSCMSSKRSNQLSYTFIYGAGGGGRTRTPSPGPDFESGTSANSITPAIMIFRDDCDIIPHENQKGNTFFQKNSEKTDFF